MPKESTTPSSNGSLPSNRPVVVIADRDPAIRDSLRRMLNGAGYDARAPVHPAGILAALSGTPVRALILDLDTFGNHWDCLLEALCDNGRQEYPILALAGSLTRLDLEHARNCGILLEKPVEAAELVRDLDKLIEQPMAATQEREVTFCASLRLLWRRANCPTLRHTPVGLLLE